MMNDDEGVGWEVKLGALILILFTVSCFKSCEQIGYSASGISTMTTVSSIVEERGRGGRTTGYRIEYPVPTQNRGRQMTGYTVVGEDTIGDYWVGQPIEVEYIGTDPLSFSSRIKGTGSTFWPILFAIFVLLMLAGITWMVVFAWLNRDQGKAPRRR